MAFDVKFSEGSASFKTAFDKYVAGTGGGSTSKYQQPDWGAEEPIEILPEATYEIDPEAGMGYILNEFSLEAGQKYVVNLSGMIELECIAVEISEGDTTMTAIGNTGALLGGAMTNEPFAIIRVPEEMVAEAGVYGMILWFEGTPSVTLSVTKHGMYKIPAVYVEEKKPPLFVKLMKEYEGTTEILTADADFDTISAAVDAGRLVYLVDEASDDIKYNFLTKNWNSIFFAGHGWVTGGGYFALRYYVIANTNTVYVVSKEFTDFNWART